MFYSVVFFVSLIIPPPHDRVFPSRLLVAVMLSIYWYQQVIDIQVSSPCGVEILCMNLSWGHKLHVNADLFYRRPLGWRAINRIPQGHASRQSQISHHMWRFSKHFHKINKNVIFLLNDVSAVRLYECWLVRETQLDRRVSDAAQIVDHECEKHSWRTIIDSPRGPEKYIFVSVSFLKRTFLTSDWTSHEAVADQCSRSIPALRFATGTPDLFPVYIDVSPPVHHTFTCVR